MVTHEMRSQEPGFRSASEAPRILAAVQEPRIAAFLEKGLRAAGYAVEIADDMERARRLACSGRFDLLVLDVSSEADAAALLRQVRELVVPLPVILLAGKRRPREPALAAEWDVCDRLTKPFAFADLLALVRAKLRPRPRTA